MDGIWKVCPEAGGPVQFPGFNGDYYVFILFIYLLYFIMKSIFIHIFYILFLAGELICPAYHELCSTGSVSVPGQCPSSCNFNGDCIDGKCHCFLGFHGHDCSKRECLHPFISHNVLTCWDETSLVESLICELHLFVSSGYLLKNSFFEFLL